MVKLADKHKIHTWMRPEEVELREKARGYLDKVIELGLLPDNRVKNVKAFTEGQSSVVFKVDTQSSPYVVKMTTEKGGAQAEAYFLTAWGKRGIKVPHIYAVRPADDLIPISLMTSEFVTAPLLIDKYTTEEIVKKGIAREIGRTLARMHQAKGEKFGYPVYEDGKVGDYDTFSDEMYGTLIGKRTDWLMSQGVLEDADLESAKRAIAILEKDIENGTKPTLTHNDFRPYNIFATDPITVFDPDARITHPAICLGYTLLKSLVNKDAGAKEYDEILAGYREITPIDDQIVTAGIVLRGIRKLHTWQRKARFDRVAKLREVLKNKGEEIG